MLSSNPAQPCILFTTFSSVLPKIFTAYFLSVGIAGFERNNQKVTGRSALNKWVIVSRTLSPCLDISTKLSWTKLSRTIEISNNILNRFLCVFKNINLLVTLYGKRFCLFIKKSTACASRTLVGASAKIKKGLVVDAKYTPTNFLRTIQVPNEFNKALSYRQSVANVLHIVIFLNYSNYACNFLSVDVEVVNFAIAKIDNLCMYILNTV